MAGSAWTAAQVAGIAERPLPAIPALTAADVRPILAGMDLWDMWPIQQEDGRVANFGGSALWIGLSAPIVGDPGARHGLARLRLLRRSGDDWRDLGNLLPDGFSPGSREWSGSTIVDAAHRRVTLFFTATGRRGEQKPTYEQRLFQTSAELDFADGLPRIDNWTRPRPIVSSDWLMYDPADQAEGEPGAIKAFRDPAWFRDPADGTAYILFAGSLGQSASRFNGAIGLARAEDAELRQWTLLPPIVHADKLNNELERPHILVRDGSYYLFWSTQRSVFSPAGPAGPTGLYGMVANSILGPWRPLNGTGLVLCNPPQEPAQAYSWLVLDDLSVASFVDIWGMQGRSPSDAAEARRHFGGTIAPFAAILLDADEARPA